MYKPINSAGNKNDWDRLPLFSRFILIMITDQMPDTQNFNF